ncbi:substrate-binding domain-containing protein [Parafilimonas sp.]|uniref:hybrid sensor histidine kinase/response regulator transcription factor n=1 Tax=Parafilimonas sp. TaxID=1969739 RepID=UPI0039E53352
MKPSPETKLLRGRDIVWIACCFFAFISIAFSCKQEIKNHKYTIAFSQCVGGDTWRQTMLQEMQRELSFHTNIKFLYKDAGGNSAVQAGQIDSLLLQKPDVLIVSPNEMNALIPAIEKAYNSGIPVIEVDRRINSEKHTAFIGASNYEVGENAGKYAAALLKGKGNVAEITGMPENASYIIDRHNGFVQAISHYPQIALLKRLNNQVPADKRFASSIEAYLSQNKNIDLIYAQNDFMALDAYKACKKLGLEKEIKIIGIDGLPVKGGGLDMVANKYIDATILYPTGGQEAIQTALKILEKQPFPRENQLGTVIIDSTNVRIMQLQNAKMQEQQQDIDRRQKVIEQQELVTQNQSLIIYAISVTLALALILGGILFYYFQENKKINLRLAHQNEEILNQRNQLIELGRQAQQASEAKINFFTNISHEFRTPITLILAPLEEMKNNNRLDNVSKQYVSLIQKNSLRLLKLVNELIDFRKIESGKYKLQVTENDLVQFAEETLSAFKTIARKRNIDLRLITKERSIKTWFDVSMMDKVLFNLLSNAFKFTSDGGYIYVELEREEHTVTVKVEDNGIGMSPQFVTHAFELFYQENIGDKLGSGLGLSLSKELIQLHNGAISVQSKQGKGTTFTIVLPLGKENFSEEQIAEERYAEKDTVNENMFLTQLGREEIESNDTGAAGKSDNTILIIEDNADLRGYLAQKLGENYDILEADNGVAAVRQAFDNVPDLIISDINLPGKDGFTITNMLKTDIRTSHIPIILLTAKTAMQEQVEGMKSKADAYVTKPFNMLFLEETIKSILKNREILREHYTSQLPVELKSQPVAKKLDRKFINEFTSIVEKNMGNVSFSIDEICRAIGISRIQLYRKVKALLGCNVNDYILSVRLQKAKYLLNETDISIAEIADNVGFSSAAYFSTVFKNRFVVTPKDFRDKGKVVK